MFSIKVSAIVEDTKSSALYTSWSLIVFLLSIYIIVEQLIEVIVPFSPYTKNVLDTIDFIICIVFLLDFFFFLILSSDRKQYCKERWIDLVASIPFIYLLRVLRIFRVVRLVRMFKILRLLRSIKGFLPIIRYITKNKLRSIFITYISLLSFIMLYCSLAFYMLEKGTNASVRSYFDAIWWSFITVTSVGYGDVYPTTTVGRLIGMLLTLLGMGLFSLITAEISAKFVLILKEEENKKA